MVIVAAVDRSDRATEVTKEAAALAEAFDDELHVVHVLTTSDFVELERTNVENTGETLDMDEVQAVAREIAEEAASGIQVPLKNVGLTGEPAARIVTYTVDEDARYAVLCPRKRSPTGKALFGSVGQSVLLNANCPVVTTIEQK
jgi:nucleotide-binding universal stress UspA family protein